MHRSPFVAALGALAALALFTACGSPSSASPAPAKEPAKVAAPVVAPPPVAVAVAPPVPAGPPVERKPLTLLVTGDVWGEYAPCG